jgi:Cullin family/Cullin protein neddylation domain
VNIARVFEEFLQEQAKEIRGKGPNAELMLKEYLRKLTEYQQTSLSVSKICHYLQRYWIPGNTGKSFDDIEVRNIYPLALVMWREHCFNPIKEQLIPSLLDLLDADRSRTRGDFDKHLLENMVQSYIEFDKVGPSEGQQFYEKEFEKKYLQRLESFYNAESTEFLSHNSVAQYCEKAEARILEEDGNASFLGTYAASSKPKIKNCLDKVLILNHMDRLQGDFFQMLQEDRYEDMRRLYFLLERVENGLPSTADTMNAFLQSVGEKIVKAQADRNVKDALQNAVAFVKELMAFYDKYATLVKDQFGSHQLFKTSLDKAMKEVINLPAGKFNIPRLLNFFLDSIIKGKEKDVASEDEVEDVLSTCVALFTYLRDKDEFYEYYRKALSKRLLSKGKSYSENSEKSLLSKLKAQSGDAAIRKLQGMFTDVEKESLQQTKDEFQKFNGGAKVGNIDVEVAVLNEGHWPINGTQKFPLLLGREMLEAREKFNEFYKGRYEKRSLDWLYNYGTVTLKSYFTNSKLPVELVITPLQSNILLAFNDRKELSFAELVDILWGEQSSGRTMLTSSQTSSALHDLSLQEILKFAITPLIYFKFKVLQKIGDPDPKKEAVSQTDSFRLRDRIPAKKLPRKIPFPPGTAKQAEKESNQDKEAVMRQREFEMEAAMVRVMKARNRLGWNDVQVEVISQLKERFLPDSKMLKKRLESLIDRKFMERSEDDPKIIVYIS